LDFSIIIPTYNRADDLKCCLDSIIIQTKIPNEIIIIDDSDNEIVEQCLNNYQKEMHNQNILLKYIRNYKERSLTIARNIGIENSSGDIILFLDDDIILEENYLEELLKTYQNFPEVMGIQGKITNFYRPGAITGLYNRLFLLDQISKYNGSVMPSVFGIYPSLTEKNEVFCEWLSGCNQSYKKDVFKTFRFDENLRKYSYKEDMDFSYRILKEMPDSLLFTPYARCIHNVSPASRIPKEEKIFMEMVYSVYLFYKIIKQSRRNKILFIWSRIGYFMKNIAESVAKKPRNPYLMAKYQLKSQIFSINHIEELKKGDLGFFNEFLSK
jgi:GT2 family glycosyltransferase